MEGEREMIEGELLTSKEVINLLKISKSTLLRWVQNGKLPSHHAGSKLLRFKRDDVMGVLSKYEPSIKVDSEQERIAKARELKGICSHLPGGSEEFMREKHNQTEEEERLWEIKVKN